MTNIQQANHLLNPGIGLKGPRLQPNSAMIAAFDDFADPRPLSQRLAPILGGAVALGVTLILVAVVAALMRLAAGDPGTWMVRGIWVLALMLLMAGVQASIRLPAAVVRAVTRWNVRRSLRAEQRQMNALAGSDPRVLSELQVLRDIAEWKQV